MQRKHGNMVRLQPFKLLCQNLRPDRRQPWGRSLETMIEENGNT
jgi:hypothetical protein